MAHTLRNVSREAHVPSKEKLLTGETGKGIGSVKKMAIAAAAAAKAKREKEIMDSEEHPATEAEAA